MKTKYLILIFVTIASAFLFYKYVNINEILKESKETNMENCKRFEMDKCIIS